VLYEVGIVISKRVMKKKQREHDEFMGEEPAAETSNVKS
jgi:Sec-independent protein secretion pathway component TatC